MSSRDILEEIINNFDTEKWVGFFRSKSSNFGQATESLRGYDDDYFGDFRVIGDIDFPKEVNKVIVVTAKAKKSCCLKHLVVKSNTKKPERFSKTRVLRRWNIYLL